MNGLKFFDLHCDTPYVCHENGLLFDGEKTAVSPAFAECFEEWRQCFAVFVKDDKEAPFEYYKSVLNDFKKKLKNVPGNLVPYFTVEGGAVIEDDISRLSELKKDGICALTLTWNGKNRIASGCYESGGLASFGQDVIREMNRLGMLCDLSHINEQGFFDAVKIAEYPIATHSNCKAVFQHPRNLSDEQLKAIAEKSGIIGICCYPEFLGCDVFEGIYANISHLLKLGLEENIAFGSDFDGAKMDERLDNPSKIPALAEFLLKKGLKNSLIEKIFYNNSKKCFVCL